MSNKCKKLGNRAIKRDILDAHRAKMEMKRILNSDHEDPRPFVFANLSRHHENYGEQPREQTARMLAKKSS